MPLFKIATHLADEFTRGIRSMFEALGNIANGVIADAKLVLIDEGIVDTVDGEIAKFIIIEELCTLIMAKPKRLEKILIDDVRACRNNRIRHPIFDEVDNHFLESGANERTGKTH